MASTSSEEKKAEPDLHPLYPTTGQITLHLSSHAGLTHEQKQELVTHCLMRACIFGDLQILQFLLTDPHARAHVDVAARDDEGIGLVSTTIHGFGSDSEREVEREECVRFLVGQGADLSADNVGWTPLHHAALLSPPTLISFLMTHGCSPFAKTRRNLTPLDIVTAHTVMPGREDVATLLEQAMRVEGWEGGRMEERRRSLDAHMKRRQVQLDIRTDIGKLLDLNPKWWGPQNDLDYSSSESDDEDEEEESLYTPPADYASMLVFSPDHLPQIFDSLITNFPVTLRNSQPANTLYLLARFACLTCDHTWLEDLIIGATDTIEDSVFNHGEDITNLVFWLYNLTVWLHLMECDKTISEACEMLGSFEIIEEVINSVFVFIIRFAERKIDELMDAALLDHSPLASEFESVQFESDQWSFFRSFGSKKRGAPSNVHSSASSIRSNGPSAPPSPRQPPMSPTSATTTLTPSSSRGFQSLRQTIGRGRANSSTPLHLLFAESQSTPTPESITAFLTALHTLLVLSGVNPALTTQLWSQIMYWTSCEVFNRIITRKKYLCRSRAVQMGMNISVIEEWVGQMGLPRGVQSHFAPVRDLLNWLQCLSSITEFPNLIATIQTLKAINPLQMRRAVRDYKYEVNEGHMTDECIQYLTQLQKDWERHRVKLGVEALRKEQMNARDGDDSVSLQDTDSASISSMSINNASDDIASAQQYLDMLFDRSQDKTIWEPAKPPQALGELLDSRYMLPLLLPSDPRLLAAQTNKLPFLEDKKGSLPESRSASRASMSSRGSMSWAKRHRKVRELPVGSLQFVDGAVSASRWTRAPPPVEDVEEDEDSDNEDAQSSVSADQTLRIDTHITPLTRKPSARKGRVSAVAEEPGTPTRR
ncbi:DIL domain-containing protein [Schizophyllum commune]